MVLSKSEEEEPIIECKINGKIWARNNFRKTNTKPIKHEKEIRDLLQSCLGPTELSIVKCDAHQKGEDQITLGNNFADQTEKAAAKKRNRTRKRDVSINQGPDSYKKNMKLDKYVTTLTKIHASI